MRESLRSTLSVLLVVAVVVGGIPAIGMTAAAQSGAPDGMTTIGSTQISEDLPAGADVPIRAADLEGSIHSSAHASTMDVVLTTPERASDHVEGAAESNTISAGNLAIVVSDDTNHDGRTIGLDRSLLSELGYEPTAVFGVHSSGTEWSAPVDYRDDVATFDVERFSSNTVTFSGGIGLSGESASDGTQFEYELDSLDGVDDYSINLTGVTNTEQATQSGTIDTGESKTINVGGTTAPSGPGGSPEVDLTSQPPVVSEWNPDTSGKEFTLEDGQYVSRTIDVSDAETLEAVAMVGLPSWMLDGHYIDIQVEVNGVDMGTERYSGAHENTFDSGTVDVSGDSEATVTVTQVGSYAGDGNTNKFQMAYDDTHYIKSLVPPLESVTVSSNSDSVTLDPDGSGSLDLSSGSETITVTGDKSGLPVKWSLNYTARSETVDPVVEVNGYETSHEGTLAAGETVSLPTQEAWISEGTNRVNVSTSSPSSGPGSLVDLEYSHEASSVSTAGSVNATTWREEVTVSNTFPGAQSDATARVTFSEETVGIASIEKRVNSDDSADWTPVHESAYSWDPNASAVVVELGDVEEDTDVDLRASASKVDVKDGEIDVLDPTIEGNTLDSRIEVVSAGEDFGIEVTGTAPNPLVHYLHDPSYSEDAHAEVLPTQRQTLRLPEAHEGATTNVRAAPLEVNPSGERVLVTIYDPDQPQFRFEHGPAGPPGDVEVTYYDTVPGEEYQLYSIDRKLEDGEPKEATSPVTLVSSGWASTYRIETVESGTGPIVGGTSDGDGSPVPSILAVFLGLTVPILGTFATGRYFGWGRSSTRLLVGIVGVSGTLLALELAGGRLVTDALYVFSDVSGIALASAVESGVATVVAGLAILLGIWVVNLRTSQEIPRWLMGLSTVLVVIWMLEAISGGILTAGLDEVAPVMWLIGGGGGFVLLFLWIRAKGEPNTVISVTGETQK